MNKILKREELKAKVDALRKEGKKIAFTNGCFDILHVGHVRYLTEARKTADILILASTVILPCAQSKEKKGRWCRKRNGLKFWPPLNVIDFITHIFRAYTTGTDQLF